MPDVPLPVHPAPTHAPEERCTPGATDHDSYSMKEVDAESTPLEARISGTTQIDEDSKETATNTEPAQADLEINREPTIDVPPFTPLDYNIPEETFRTARAAPEGSAGSFWSYTLYRGPEDPEQKNETDRRVKVHYCRSAHTAERALQYLLNEEFLGLDLEWVPEASRFSGPRRNVSLVQLASQSRIVLLHLSLYPYKDTLATPTLRKILEDPAVTKLGVWIKGDCARLKRYLGIECSGLFELSHLFNQVKHSANGTPELINKKLVSLAKQVQEMMGLPLFKEQNVRASDWSQPLNIQQIGYSASDAYAGVQLFAMLNHKRQELDPAPPLPFHAELDRPIPHPPGLETPTVEESSVEEGIADEAVVEANGNLEDTVMVREESLFIEAADNEQSFVANATTESEIDTSALPTPKRKTTKSTTTSARGPVDPTDPRIIAAETLYSEYKSTRPGGKTKATASKLRAYFLWHTNEDLNPEGIGQMLRVQPNTVINYILDTVTQEKLPYDKVRMKAEVTSRYPLDVVQWRYSSVWRATKDIVISSSE